MAEDEQRLIQDAALFLTAFLRHHAGALEAAGTPEAAEALRRGHLLLLRISYVDEPEIFKGCVDYWHGLVLEIFSAESVGGGRSLTAGGWSGGPLLLGQGGEDAGTAEGGAGAGEGGGGRGGGRRRAFYGDLLSQLRLLMVDRMAKPEEARCSLFIYLNLLRLLSSFHVHFFPLFLSSPTRQPRPKLPPPRFSWSRTTTATSSGKS